MLVEVSDCDGLSKIGVNCDRFLIQLIDVMWCDVIWVVVLDLIRADPRWSPEYDRGGSCVLTNPTDPQSPSALIRTRISSTTQYIPIFWQEDT